MKSGRYIQKIRISYDQLETFPKDKVATFISELFCLDFVCFNIFNRYITIYPIIMQTKFLMLLSKVEH